MQNSKEGMLSLGKLIHMLFYKGTYKSIASTVKYKRILSMSQLSPVSYTLGLPAEGSLGCHPKRIESSHINEL